MFIVTDTSCDGQWRKRGPAVFYEQRVHFLLLDRARPITFHAEYTIFKFTVDHLSAEGQDMATRGFEWHVDIGVQCVLATIQWSSGTGQKGAFRQRFARGFRHAGKLTDTIVHRL